MGFIVKFYHYPSQYHCRNQGYGLTFRPNLRGLSFWALECCYFLRLSAMITNNM